MRYLSRAAAQVYLEITRQSFLFGLVGWSQLVGRLEALRELCAPSNPVRIHAERVLRIEDELLGDDWPDGEVSEPGMTDAPKRSFFGNELRPDPAADEEDGYLYLFPGGHTGLAHWQFHLYDDDPFPAVPHGHHKKDKRQKLDPYQGWMYQRTHPIGREPRWKIVALWNDREFRAAALIAIDYYMVHHRQYVWRVNNPRRLPRRR